MATIKPFKAIRPTIDKVNLVASRSVDGYNLYELKDKLEANPYSFLHVINPDFADGVRTKPGSIERLNKVKKRFKEFVSEEIFIQDEQPAYYIYRQIKDKTTFVGIIACSSINDYLKGTIKIHEQTITHREQKLKEYLKVCEFNAEPVLFSYPDDEVINQFCSEAIKHRPEYDFTTTDRIRHSVWVISSAEQVGLIEQRFKAVETVYIADGHHRSASSALLGKEKGQNNPNHTGLESYNFYLGVFFPESQLKIYDYNRVVKDLNGLSVDQLLSSIKNDFDIVQIKEELFVPQKKHQLSMFINNTWYALTAHSNVYNSSDPVGSLDAQILTEKILTPLLNIKDLKTDKRIGFVPGVKGAKTLKKLVTEGKFAVAFGLYPVTMDHLKWIADTNKIMPPKSTWIEPKMRSGLLVYSIEETNQ
ncbi:MAG: DUF1015 domain-containing protein [Bacteroidetes bacterium]|jgi:uncharacterized protein (DUF1015 family)|nr:DUF1015 domain-containing protein [Bacteroidota bacterium]MCA6443663.1 DUF1015 domain-containing protein [Bacteroidota bacterium]